MAIIKNGDYIGSIGRVVYQNSMGKTIAREKPANYHDRKSPEQVEQRSKHMASSQHLTKYPD